MSFFAVRKFFVVNPAPTNALARQRIGRVMRSCRHAPLPKAQRNVEIITCVATNPSKEPTADEILLKRVEEEGKALTKALHKDFRKVAVDRQVLAPHVKE